MQQNHFSSSSVLSFIIGRNESIPENFATLPTVWMEQTHSANVIEVSEAQADPIPNVDGIFTKQKNLLLKVKHADCLPVLLYHPSGIVGAVHAGRKGTEKGVLRVMLEKLKTEHGVASGVMINFGPAICDRCYQIDEAQNLHYNLMRKNIDQVREVFSAAEAEIFFSNRCTAHENKHFYSFRKEGPGVPMNWSGIVLIK